MSLNGYGHILYYSMPLDERVKINSHKWNMVLEEDGKGYLYEWWDYFNHPAVRGVQHEEFRFTKRSTHLCPRMFQ